MSTRTARRASRTLALLALLGVLACAHAAPISKLQTLDPSFESLRRRFNADASHVRVLALLSPT